MTHFAFWLSAVRGTVLLPSDFDALSVDVICFMFCVYFVLVLLLLCLLLDYSNYSRIHVYASEWIELPNLTQYRSFWRRIKLMCEFHLSDDLQRLAAWLSG